MRVIFIDFETYYNSKTYTLSKMGPIEYVRDPRFAVLCVGVQIGHGETVVCPAENGLDAEFLEALELDKPGTLVVGHNMAGFDALVLSEHYGIHPWMVGDTIPMMNWCGLSRIIRCTHKELTAKLGHGIKKPGTLVSDDKYRKDFTEDEWNYFMEYCRDDVSQCADNFYSMLPYMTADALQLISVTAKMATEPAFVPDIPMLIDYVRQLDDEQEKARLDLAHVLHYKTTEELMKAIRSPKIFPTLMERVGGVCPMKWSDKKQCDVPATAKNDLEFVAMAEDPNPDVALLVQTRLNLNSSIQRSRADALIRKGSKPVPIMLATYKAHTGRYAAGSNEGSDKLNFQNMSKRDPSKVIIRKALKVTDGYKVIACDSSQVEARMLAWESEQEDLVEQFRTGRDPYAEMASKIFGQSAQEIHDGAKQNNHHEHNKLKMERNVGKTCILSCLSADTEVLTDTGWKPIIDVSLTDKLWDGEQWVNHAGLSYNGMKKTIELAGLRLTKNHLIWNGTIWIQASRFIDQPKSLKSAVKFATAQLPMCELSSDQTVSTLNCCSNVINVVQRNGLMRLLSINYQQTAAQIVRKVMQTVYPSLKDSILTMKLVQKLENLLCWRMQYALPVLEMANHETNESLKCNAAVGLNHTGYCSPISIQAKQLDVIYVQKRKLMLHAIKNITSCETLCLMTKQDADLWDESIRAMNVATVKHIDCTNTMEHAVSRLSSKISTNLCNILSHYLDMTTLTKHLIASTIMEIMQKVISDLLHSLGKPVINVQSMICSRNLKHYANKSQNYRQSSPSTKVEPVYDLLNAGPKHRFTVRTNLGALIVHNCGYGIGAKAFSQYLLQNKVKLSEDLDEHFELSSQAHMIYRRSSPAITRFWKLCNDILWSLCTNHNLGEHGRFGRGQMFSYGWCKIPCTDTSAAYIRLPNDFYIWYPDLHTAQDQFGGISMFYKRFEHGKLTDTRITGPKCVENITQSLAFHMLAWQACRMDDAGIKLKANIHDSFCTVVPESIVKETKNKMEEVMSSVPEWLKGFPVGCEAEIGDDFTVV